MLKVRVLLTEYVGKETVQIRLEHFANEDSLL